MEQSKIKLKEKIIKASKVTGEFKLRSGQISNVYFDKYKFESDPVLLKEICFELNELIAKDAEILAGLEMGGIPIATVLSQLSNIPTAFIRKTAKEYGTCKYAEGIDLNGKKVVIIEDIVSSGSAIIEAAKKMQNDGIKITEAYCVIDRESGGKENLSKMGIKLSSLFKMSELF